MLLALCGSCLIIFGFPETIDRIVAVVNDQVITLTDIRVIKTFALFEEEMQEQKREPSFILKRLIDQKLVIQLSGEQIKIDHQEVEAYIKKLSEKIGEERIQKMLVEFGFDANDLGEYIQEKIFYQKLISRKFGQRVVVSLDEIEDYYSETYIRSQEERGLEPQPMIEILRDIESKIIEKKIQSRGEEWLGNLRNQADIHIMIENLDEYFKKEGSSHE